jgi:hypothetical protein
MNLKELLPDSFRKTADQACTILLNHPEDLPQMIQLSFAEDRTMGMRASRVVLLFYEQNPSLLKPLMPEIFDQLYITKNSSTIRNLLHLFIKDFTLLDENRFGKLLEFCFNLLDSPSAEIAHRALAMQVLYQVSNKLTDLKGELKALIEIHYEEGSSGFKCTANNILKKLNREITGI